MPLPATIRDPGAERHPDLAIALVRQHLSERVRSAELRSRRRSRTR